MNRSDVPRLHLISNSQICDLERFIEVARRAVDGGVDSVHLREKGTPAATLLATARALRAQVGGSARLFINDRIDVAMASKADGVQLGETSMPVPEVRELVGPGVLIGRSIHDVDGARQAEAEGADFVIAGHVYETASKRGQAGRGPRFVEAVAAACSIPVIAIGGITPQRLPEVIHAGAHGVAVISGILNGPDPGLAARRYVEAIERSN